MEFLNNSFSESPYLSIFGEHFTKKVVPLKFMAISKLQDNLINLNMLKNYSRINEIHYDFIFLLGDIDNLSEADKKVEELNIDSEGKISCTIDYLENFRSKIFYIPGITDSSSLLNEPAPLLTFNSLNIHRKSSLIEKSLAVVGIGNIISENKSQSSYAFANLETWKSTLCKSLNYCKNYNEEAQIILISYLDWSKVMSKDEIATLLKDFNVLMVIYPGLEPIVLDNIPYFIACPPFTRTEVLEFELKYADGRWLIDYAKNAKY